MAVAARNVDPGGVLIHHSDRGSQYTSADFTDALVDYGLLASLGSVGDAYDNALAESFVDSFKTELVADRVWRSRSELELAIVEWVGWYNHRRRGDISRALKGGIAIGNVHLGGRAHP